MSIVNIASPRMMLVGGGAVRQLPEVLAKFGLSRPLVVTDPFMVSSGMAWHCLDPVARNISTSAIARSAI